MKKRFFSLFMILLLAAALFTGCKSKDKTTTAAATTTDLASVVETTKAASGTTAAATTPAATEEGSAASKTEEATRAATTEAATEASKAEPTAPPETQAAIDEDGKYYSKDEVALYIHTYGHLPSNYVTKKEAKAAGWTGGSLEPYFPGCAIGGDYFGNYEGLLPKKKGRSYYECDIDTKGKRSRGAKRIIFSNDGYIYYTDDHYESFTELYKGGVS